MMRAGFVGVMCATSVLAHAAPCGAPEGAELTCGASLSGSVNSIRGSDIASYPSCATDPMGRSEALHTITCTEDVWVDVTVSPSGCPLDVAAIEGNACDSDGCVDLARAPNLAPEQVTVRCSPGMPAFVSVEQDPRVAFGTACATQLVWSYAIEASCTPITSSPALTGPTPLVAELSNTVTVSSVTPGGTVWLGVSGAPGSTAVPGCPGLSVGLKGAVLAASGVADGLGTVDLDVVPPQHAAGRVWGFQAVDLTACTVSDVAVVPITR